MPLKDILRVLKQLLTDPGEKVPEQVGAYYRFTRHDAKIFLDPLSFNIWCGCDNHELLIMNSRIPEIMKS
jgi:hypothetical protein